MDSVRIAGIIVVGVVTVAGLWLTGDLLCLWALVLVPIVMFADKVN